jgi:hypothetical protein
MSRNFELMTQLGLQVGVKEKLKQDATQCEGASGVVPPPNGEAGNVREEEMVRFILEMFPRGGSASKV